MEVPSQETFGRDGGKNGSQALSFGFGAGELFGIGLDEIGSDGRRSVANLPP